MVSQTTPVPSDFPIIFQNMRAFTAKGKHEMMKYMAWSEMIFVPGADCEKDPTDAIIFEFLGTPSQIITPPIFSDSFKTSTSGTAMKRRRGRLLLSFLAAEFAAESTVDGTV